MAVNGRALVLWSGLWFCFTVYCLIAPFVREIMLAVHMWSWTWSHIFFTFSFAWDLAPLVVLFDLHFAIWISVLFVCVYCVQTIQNDKVQVRNWRNSKVQFFYFVYFVWFFVLFCLTVLFCFLPLFSLSVVVRCAACFVCHTLLAPHNLICLPHARVYGCMH